MKLTERKLKEMVEGIIKESDSYSEQEVFLQNKTIQRAILYTDGQIILEFTDGAKWKMSLEVKEDDSGSWVEPNFITY